MKKERGGIGRPMGLVQVCPPIDGDLQTAEAVARQAQLIETHMGWVINEAARYHRGFETVEFDELVQVGRLAIVLADQRWRPDTGCRFLGYAKHWIRAHMSRHCFNTAKQVRVPVNQWESCRGKSTREVSLNEPLRGDSAQDGRPRHWEDVLPAHSDGEHGLDQESEWAALRDAVAELKPKFRHILNEYFFKEKPLRVIAAEMGITNQGVSHRIHTALGLLRKKQGLRRVREIAR